MLLVKHINTTPIFKKSPLLELGVKLDFSQFFLIYHKSWKINLPKIIFLKKKTRGV